MRIKIIGTQLKRKGNVVVRFVCNYGEADAAWLGDPPSVNKEYEVELEARCTLSVDKDIYQSTEEGYFIKNIDSGVEIRGMLESVIEEDKVAMIRLGDNIFSIEFCGNLSKEKNFVVLKVDKLYLSNINF